MDVEELESRLAPATLRFEGSTLVFESLDQATIVSLDYFPGTATYVFKSSVPIEGFGRPNGFDPYTARFERINQHATIKILLGNFSDEVLISANGHPVDILTGGGSDAINIGAWTPFPGDLAQPSPNLGRIQADISLDAQHGGDDRLHILDSVDGRTINVGPTAISWSGSAGRISSYDAIDSISIDTGLGANCTLNLNATSTAVTVQRLRGGTINIGSGDLSRITLPVTLVDCFQSSVNLFDHQFPGAEAYRVERKANPAWQIHRPGFGGVTASSMEGTGPVTLNARNGDNVFDVVYTGPDDSSPPRQALTINCGDGNDTINADTRGWNLKANGQGGSNDQLILKDRIPKLHPSQVRNYLVSSTSIFSFDRPGPASEFLLQDLGGLEGVTLHTVREGPGSVGSVVDVDSTRASTQLSIIGSSVRDVFRAGRLSGVGLTNLAGAVSFLGGGGFDTLELFDGNAPAAGYYTITSDSIQRSGIGRISYLATESLTLEGTARSGTFAVGDTFLVNSTLLTTPVTINANAGYDRLFLGGTLSNLDGLAGPVTFRGGPDGDRIFVNDAALARRDTYGVTSTTVVRSSGFGGLTYFEAEGLELTTQTGYPQFALGNSITVSSTAALTPVTIHAGNADDVITIGNGQTNLIASRVLVSGGLGTNTLLFNNSASTVDETATLRSPLFIHNRVEGLRMAVPVEFFSIKNLLIATGSGRDVITNLIDPSSGIVVSLNLGSGQDGVVFHGTPGDDNLVVSRQVINGLPHAILSNHGQVQASVIYQEGETVYVHAGAGNDRVELDDSAAFRWSAGFFGGAGDDVLVGNRHNDILVGGRGRDQLTGADGRDLLIGGPGRDGLNGTVGEDMLIEGATSFDDNREALTAILLAWCRTDLTIEERMGLLDYLRRPAQPYEFDLKTWLSQGQVSVD